MKAKDLKALISQIPNEDEVGWVEYDSSNEEYTYDIEFNKPELFYKTGTHKVPFEKMWIITNGNQKIEYLTSAKLVECINIKETIISTFPVKEFWTISRRYDEGFSVKFVFGLITYNFEFGLNRFTTPISFTFINGPTNTINATFTNWDNFFVEIDPLIKKWLQIRREELEELVDKLA